MVELGLEVAMLSQHVVLGYVPVVVDEAKYVGSHLVKEIPILMSSIRLC